MARRRQIVLPLLAVAVTALCAGPPAPRAAEPSGTDGRTEPRRLRAEALGLPLSVEVRDLTAAAAEEALRDAFRHLQATVRLLEETEERLNADARSERAVTVEAPAFELLRRAREFCRWSDGAVGPLGGGLRDHWQAAAGNPSPPPVSPALAEAAACDRLALDPETSTVRVAAGSRVALAPFATGFAVDRTVEKLRELGVANGRVRLGRIERAFGAGPRRVDDWGEPLPAGWPAALPTFEGHSEPLDRLRLTDHSLAVLWRADWPGDHPLHVDQRNGRPPEGVWATVAVTELAVDAQALAVAAMVLGSREGRFRMAGLEPEPSVLWLMGRGRGRALRSDLNWADLAGPASR